jgi:NAD(P)-dependent dehydrogenase (short-subunit alcohol dehydrogenase family)
VVDPERYVVITGASSGIGEACALYLARLGFGVFAGVRKKEDAQALRARGVGRIEPLFVDVTDADSVASAAETVRRAADESRLAGLVNNAGIAVAAPLEFLPLEELRRQLEINVVGQIAVTQAFMPLLREGSGRVVNVGSIGGKIAGPMLGAYAASKFAMEGLTDSLRRELEPWAIHVAIVEPGAVRTPIWERSLMAADALLHQLPRRALLLYGSEIERQRSSALEAARKGIPPEIVARAVAHALTTERPKTRYPVGRDARVASVLVRLLPDRVLDRIAGL